MVKPPRTMQPEAVDLKKAGRAAGKAFQEDSFRNYMARKIDMQRRQFGLVIPPPPPPPPPRRPEPPPPPPKAAGALTESKEEEKKGVTSAATTTTTTKATYTGRSRRSCDRQQRHDDTPRQRGPQQQKDEERRGAPSVSPSSSAAVAAAAGCGGGGGAVRFHPEAPSTKKRKSPAACDGGDDDDGDGDDHRGLSEQQRRQQGGAAHASGEKGRGRPAVNDEASSSSSSSALGRQQTRERDGDDTKEKKKKKKNLSGKRKKLLQGLGLGVAGSISGVVKRLKRRHGRVYRLKVVEVDDEGEQEVDACEMGDASPGALSEKETTAAATAASEAERGSDRCNLSQIDESLRQEKIEASGLTTDATCNRMDSSMEECSDAISVRQDDAGIGEAEPPIGQEEEDQASVINKRTRPDLFFLGVVVLVNGYTNPDAETLQRTLHRHGGDVERYETSRVTHVIAERLSTAKAAQYSIAKRRNPLPVCRPSWIVDSVRAGRLLPHTEYLVDEVRGDDGAQKSVASFFQKKNCNSVAVVSGAGASDAKSCGFHAAGASASRYSADGSTHPNGKRKRQEVDRHVGASAAQKMGDVDEIIELDMSSEDEGACGDSRVEDAEVDDERVRKVGAAARAQRQLPERATSVDSSQSVAVAAVSTKEPAETRLASAGKSIESSMTATAAAEGNEPTSPAAASSSPGKRSDDKYINGRVRTVGTDPNFLDSFFNASRLSFIGSYKQRARPSPTKQRSTAAKKKGRRFVFHVDMDCFFAQVVLRNYPEYRGMPVAISHHGVGKTNVHNMNNSSNTTSSNARKDSTSECATCNYEARRFGIKKGMFLGRAKQLCPSLVVLQYDFEGYEEVSDQVAEILFRVAAEHDGSVEQVSCDEAYMELRITDGDGVSTEKIAGDLASSIRQEIFERTQCTASIGIATNKLLAKLGTDRVKPNGSFVVEDYRDLLRPLKLRDLHGVGYHLDRKLSEAGLTSILDVWDLGDSAEAELTRILGPGTGKKVFSFCHGKDDRPIAPAERKTIGAECNYGVRFNGDYGVEHMIAGLAKEVEKRMSHVAVKGSKVTLKLKQRVEGAPPPGKFLGHGHCHNLSRSCDIGEFTRDWKVLARHSNRLFAELGVDKDDVRGMGLIVSKLVPDGGCSNPGSGSNQNLKHWFKDSTSTSNKPHTSAIDASEKTCDLELDVSDEEQRARASSVNQDRRPTRRSSEEHSKPRARDSAEATVDDSEFDIALPSLSQIHMSQVEALPTPMRERALSKIGQMSRAVHHEQESESTALEKPARFRQTNVKRMLRLLNVKAGNEVVPQASGEGVSLTQLEALPLETQLQVANGDRAQLGALSQRVQKKRRKGRAATTQRKAFRLYPDRSKAAAREAAADGKGEEEAKSAAFEIPIPLYPDPRDFFRDDVYPLSIFLDENPEADTDAMERVRDFLLICVDENRLPDVVKLLRSVKNRGDVWSSDPCFGWLLGEVNHAVACTRGKGSELDTSWI